MEAIILVMILIALVIVGTSKASALIADLLVGDANTIAPKGFKVVKKGVYKYQTITLSLPWVVEIQPDEDGVVFVSKPLGVDRPEPTGGKEYVDDTRYTFVYIWEEYKRILPLEEKVKFWRATERKLSKRGREITAESLYARKQYKHYRKLLNEAMNGVETP